MTLTVTLIEIPYPLNVKSSDWMDDHLSGHGNVVRYQDFFAKDNENALIRVYDMSSGDVLAMLSIESPYHDPPGVELVVAATGSSFDEVCADLEIIVTQQIASFYEACKNNEVTHVRRKPN